MLKLSGTAGRYELSIEMVAPDGCRREYPSREVVIHPDEFGSLDIFSISAEFEDVGTYWFELSIGDRLATRIPMTVLEEYALGELSAP